MNTSITPSHHLTSTGSDVTVAFACDFESLNFASGGSHAVLYLLVTSSLCMWSSEV